MWAFNEAPIVKVSTKVFSQGLRVFYNGVKCVKLPNYGCMSERKLVHLSDWAADMGPLWQWIIAPIDELRSPSPIDVSSGCQPL